MDISKVVLELCEYGDEQEWFEFKTNWFEPVALGEYVSALSNAAAYHHRKYAFMLWGVNNDTHEVEGADFNQYCEYKKEPYQNFLARNLSPSVNFSFDETMVNGHRVVLLTIPAATEIPTAFLDRRYIRIGASKCNLKDYPKREVELFKILSNRVETMENVPAKYQNLSFYKLFGYYGSKSIVLNEKTFVRNLGLKTDEGYYNLLAQLLSDNSHIPLRVSIFGGKTKAAKLLAVREFGNNCLLYTLDELLRYGDVLNLRQADERDRVVERREVLLFNGSAFREAVINAVLHNRWVSGNEPMISVFSDRIEVLSRGSIPPTQTIRGFYLGESVPVNEKLSEIFLQLHISEKSGRGVPIITQSYGEDAFSFRENSIVVTIPFERIYNREVESEFGNSVENKVENNESRVINKVENNENKVINKVENNEDKVGKKVGDNESEFGTNLENHGENNIESKVGDVADETLSAKRKKIIEEILNNPHVTTAELKTALAISATAVTKNIAFLKKNGYIERRGAKKNGFWKVLPRP